MKQPGFELSGAGDVTAREDAGQTVEIHDAAGEPLFFTPEGGEAAQPVTVTVAGSYSALYRRTTDAQRDRAMRSRIRRTATKEIGELVTKNQIELIASCVLAWAGFANNGAPLACTKENAIAVLTQAPWIYRQVAEAVEDHEGFSKSSSASS